MNAPGAGLTPATLNLDTETLARAQALARRSQRTVVAELEALTGIEPRQFVREVASLFGMEVAETADMLVYAAAFDLLPLARALQRHCVLLRDDVGALIAVIADPFDPDLQTWLEIRARQPLRYCLALESDIQAYLSKQEESARALDDLGPVAKETRRDDKNLAVLSFASVSEAASPAVTPSWPCR